MTSKKSAKPYNPHEVEQKIYRRWERAKAFTPSKTPRRGAQPFVIAIPLPNVTGSLHMGHALQHTIMDTLTRYHRMKGDDALLMPGTDHAGIATQNVVEKQLKEEGKTRHDLGREKFVERVWQWKREYGQIIDNQMRRLGDSCDWTRYHFTMDPDYARAVNEAFIHYARKGLIYRGDRIVNWCPRCTSSISDLEVKHEERPGKLYAVTYPFADRDGGISISTTRPETMLGDTAVAVHPEDARYRDAVGRTVKVPLTERTAPVIADRAVQKDFGTGALKITPAHDHTDWEIGERHRLPVLNVIGEDGRMTAAAGKRYAGLAFEEARDIVIADLREGGFLHGEPADIRHNVALCERCGTVIQPLVSKQWFVKMAPLAKPAIDVAEQGLLQFHPPRWKRAYLDWLRNIKDWCISRQLWWGHRIPVWYCTKHREHWVAALKPPKACAVCGNPSFEQDPDVLDTWFSAALWPLAIFGWPEATDDLKRFYPTSVLTTAQEILQLWVSRMVFSSLEFMNRKTYLPAKQYGKTSARQRIPFHDVLIHQTVLNLKGQRMSKSLGTGVDPMDLITEYGADATRFGLLVQTQYDQQALRFDETVVRTGRNVVNKLWNIARFLEGQGTRDKGRQRRIRRSPQPAAPTPFDQWILARAAAVTREVTDALDAYRLGDAMRTLHAFLWDDFADWYVEVLKVEGMATPAVARDVFRTLLRLLHPFLPFVTEALSQRLQNKEMLVGAPWPRLTKKIPSLPPEVLEFQRVVQDLRSLRSLLGLKPSERILARVTVNARLLPAFTHFTHVESAPRGAGKDAWVSVAGISGSAIELPKSLVSNLSLAPQIQELKKAQETLEKTIVNLRERISTMAGKASKEAVERQREALRDEERKLAETRQALDLLGQFTASSVKNA